MHPFSRGTCFIKSSNPFEPPSIDPRWLSNPVDRQILVEALLFNRKLLATPPMMELQPAQFVPPLEADENALNEIINGGIRTEFHPSGTCAMLPLDKGGVVDPHLRVWGTENLRIVDASIFPLVPAAHLQAVVYGVAEKVRCITLSGTNDWMFMLLLIGCRHYQSGQRCLTSNRHETFSVLLCNYGCIDLTRCYLFFDIRNAKER